jgi:hypothetical protein
MTKKQEAIEWVRRNPEARQREAVEAGISKSTFWTAKRILREHTTADVSDNLTKLTEIVKALREQGMEVHVVITQKWEI